MTKGHINSGFTTLWCLLVVMLPFFLATSPLPAPYHQYNVQGVLERPAGGSKKDFAVTLQTKFRYSHDNGFQTLRGMPYTTLREIPVGLTDSTGAFYLRVSSAEKADSLRLAVIVPDRPLTVGAPFTTDGFQVIPNYESYEYDAQPEHPGCATDPEKSVRTTFYSYYIDNRIITISF